MNLKRVGIAQFLGVRHYLRSLAFDVKWSGYVIMSRLAWVLLCAAEARLLVDELIGHHDLA
jgi:hypothetical protein